jgi:hypothetical protein
LVLGKYEHYCSKYGPSDGPRKNKVVIFSEVAVTIFVKLQ